MTAPLAPALRAAGLLVAVAFLGTLCLLSLWIGSRHIPIATTWHLLWHPDGSTEAVIVHGVRAPRTVLAVAVGAALGLSGALTQALTRNPLADPGLLGVNMGAATAVVVAIAFLRITAVAGFVWFAFAGAALATLLVYALGSAGRTGATPERLVLAGASITAALGAFNMAVLLLEPAAFNKFRFWDVGSLTGRKMDIVYAVGPFLLVGSALALGLARSLNALGLGDDAGRALGARVGRTRALGAVAVTLLCGAATAAAGPIGFVGLTVPHVARMIVGPDQRWVLAYSMVLAPVLLLGADLIGRVATAPGELQVGIVTALLGGPVFLALCRRRKLARL
ncbi:iron chelate uptake ABC transporter family permease subunit [Longispora sp. K20-0274]|uniref:FecCD family ABC transporter permease n=1 Tax=Longispora sp. K20-0274 TaxID=3088255 RepID=UPI00399B975D